MECIDLICENDYTLQTIIIGLISMDTPYALTANTFRIVAHFQLPTQ